MSPRRPGPWREPSARSFLTAASCSTLLARGHFTRAHVQGTGTPGRGSARRQVGAGIGGSSSPDLPSPRARRPPSRERVLLPRPASQQDDLAPGRRPHVGAPLAQSWSLCFRTERGPSRRVLRPYSQGDPRSPFLPLWSGILVAPTNRAGTRATGVRRSPGVHRSKGTPGNAVTNVKNAPAQCTKVKISAMYPG